METGSIIMMLVSVTALWGGLAWAILRLRRHPERHDDE
ncbi:methionine/alanine import family NSS transporter small subunit [Leucobacter weissii]|uniref:Methionine/alanine import family NSS transporter small subunit n=1 Tax=Leucobacter weissii TaxID=1983706 RepID=A0A939SB63_9MICO|nr:methionine/alanine import family NSS transporter small subunit [Leucobacter weissii]